ncbi:MAG: hypothetical protein K9L78_04645 [Victivallales bacterium]|nr:hypothetical protein [Victivallales bacterium]MCF7889391.1 hypothetical protein [Victivallales bacterium]
MDTKKVINYLIFLITVCVFTSCETVPPGTAPTKTIAPVKTISRDKTLTKNTAVNAMVTQIISSRIIISQDTPPTVKFIPIPIDLNSQLETERIHQFNRLALRVYKKLLFSELIIPTTSLTDFDYALVSSFIEKPFFESHIEKFKIYTWHLSLYSPSDRRNAKWSYSLDVSMPKHKKNKKDLKDG